MAEKEKLKKLIEDLKLSDLRKKREMLLSIDKLSVSEIDRLLPLFYELEARFKSIDEDFFKRKKKLLDDYMNRIKSKIRNGKKNILEFIEKKSNYADSQTMRNLLKTIN